MKSLVTFLIFCLISTHAMAQDSSLLAKRFTISHQDEPIRSILHAMESDSLSFTYSSQTFDVEKRTSISVRNASLQSILERLFQGQSMELIEMNEQVLIRKKRIPKKNAAPDTSQTKVKLNTEAEKEVNVNRNSHSTSEVNEVNSGISNSEKTVKKIDKIETQDASLTVSFVRFEKLNKRPIRYNDEFISKRNFYTDYAFPIQDFDHFKWAPTEFKETSEERRKRRRDEQIDFSGLRFAASAFVGATSLGDDLGILIGGRIVYKFKPNYGLGIGGTAIISPIFNDANLSGDYRITGGYGGIQLEYTFFPKKAVHLNFPIMLAGGGMTYVNVGQFGLNPTPVDSKAMFIAEGGLEVEFNLFNFLMVGFGASYRHASNGVLRYQNTSETIFNINDLSGLSGAVNIKLGRF